ncbi:D-amino acid dehydrogenase [Sneathiella sp.]|uniref:D-amino acid dehydrogenase n=1 Tax=Sneathiella sp. TaxID=1964365 RepID=UPI00260E4729|nr:D-amino acid dehydrogenase [Sneathiella sp.]MDF2365646.1 D-amino acid dehydrogenase [Sneathiella sp.]
MTSVAVIGAGVTGVTTAYALLEHGYDVTVIDRERYAAMGTSFANGGQLSASNAEVWTHLGTIVKGLSWMFRADAPLLVNPWPSWHKYSWFVEFLKNTSSYQQNTIETAKMALAARKHLLSMAEAEEIEFDLVEKGILHIYSDRKSFEHAADVTKMLNEAGLERTAVTNEEIRCLEPALCGEFYGGYYTPSDFTGDIHKFTRGLAEACERKGATFLFQSDVESVTTMGEKVELCIRSKGADKAAPTLFDKAVVCAGTGSKQMAAKVGEKINIYPVKGYSITVNLNSEASRQSAPWVSLLDDDAKIVTSRLGENRFRVAGTAEFNGYNQDVRSDRINPLVGWVERHFPNVDTDDVISWSGLRPMMPNMMPRVGKGKQPGIYYNTGHGHLGWTLSAFTAQIICGMINQK